LIEEDEVYLGTARTACIVYGIHAVALKTCDITAELNSQPVYFIQSQGQNCLLIGFLFEGEKKI